MFKRKLLIYLETFPTVRKEDGLFYRRYRYISINHIWDNITKISQEIIEGELIDYEYRDHYQSVIVFPSEITENRPSPTEATYRKGVNEIFHHYRSHYAHYEER